MFRRTHRRAVAQLQIRCAGRAARPPLPGLGLAPIARSNRQLFLLRGLRCEVPWHGGAMTTVASVPKTFCIRPVMLIVDHLTLNGTFKSTASSRSAARSGPIQNANCAGGTSEFSNPQAHISDRSTMCARHRRCTVPPDVSADLMTSRSQRHRWSRPMPCARQRRLERHAERPALSIPAAGRLREFRAANRHSTACQTSGRGRFIRQSLGLMTIIAGLATVSGISHIVACLTVSPRERRATDRDRKIKANWRLRPSSTASDCLHVCFECCKRHHWRRRNVPLTETRKSFSAIARCAVFRACAARPAAQSAAHEHYR